MSLMSVTTDPVPIPRRLEGSPDPMHPVQTRVHVDHHIASLTAEAAVERLAAAQRRHHRAEHLVHPQLGHHRPATGVRGAVGRLLIGLGTAIAGSGTEAGAGRTA